MTKARIRSIREASAKNSAHQAIIAELIAEVESLQAFTRRGEKPLVLESEPEEILPRAAKVKKVKQSTGDPNVKLFIDGWYQAFLAFHKSEYFVQGAKDASAAKKLVAKVPVYELISTALKAWKHADKFNCKQAATIAGFASRYNDIVAELKSVNGSRAQQQEPARCRL